MAYDLLPRRQMEVLAIVVDHPGIWGSEILPEYRGVYVMLHRLEQRGLIEREAIFPEGSGRELSHVPKECKATARGKKLIKVLREIGMIDV